MKKNKSFLILIILFLDVIVLFSEVIILTNNKIINGKIIKLDEDTLTVYSEKGEFIIDRDDIKIIYLNYEEYKKTLGNSKVKKEEKADGDSDSILTVFSENFDSTTLNQLPKGWTASYDEQSYVGVVNNNFSYSLPNCLRLFDISDIKSANAFASIVDSKYGQLSFYFYVPATPTTNSYCKILDSKGSWLIGVCFNDSKRIEIRRLNQTKKPLMKYQFDIWYKVEIRWDKSTGYFKILINDDDFGNYKMRDPLQIINRIQFQAGTTGESSTLATILIDNVNLKTNIEIIEK